MIHVRRFRKSRLSQLIAASVLASAGTSALASEFVLESNQVFWSNEGTATSSTPATVAADGEAETISLQQTTDATTLPNVNFTLQDLSGSNTTYNLRLLMEVKGTSGNTEVEMRLGVVRVVTDGRGVQSVSMVSNSGDGSYESIQVYAKKVSGGATINLDANFSTIAGLVTDEGSGEVTINVNNVVDALIEENALFDDIIERFASVGEFDYVIGIEDVDNGAGPGNAQIGTQDSGTFTVSPFNAPALTLNGGALDGEFDNATYIGGRLSIVESIPGGGDGEPDDVVSDEDVEELDDEAEDLANEVNSEIADGEVSPATVSRTETAAETAGTQTSSVVTASNNGVTVTTQKLLDVVETASKVGATSSTVANNTASDTDTLVSRSVTIMTNSVQALEIVANRAGDQDSPLTDAEEAQVNVALDNLTTTGAQLSQKAATAADLRAISDNMVRLVATAKTMKVPVTEGTMGKLVSNSKLILRSAVRLAVGGDLPSEEQASQQLNDNPQLLNRVLDQLFPLPPSQHISSGTVNSNIDSGSSNRGLSLSAQVRTNLGRGLGAGLGVTNTFIGDQGTPTTANNIAQAILDAALGGDSGQIAILNTGRLAEISAAEGDMTAEVIYDEQTTRYTVRFGSEVYVGQAVGVKAVPAGLNPGLVMLADGRVVLVGDAGIAIELAPAPLDIFYFASALDNQSFTPTFRDNGSFSLALSDNESFSGTFAYDNLGSADVSESCGEVSFTAPTIAPNAPAYAFVMNCSDSGISQNIVPFPAQSNFFSALAGLDIDVSTDRNTGIITVSGFGMFKPSFFVSNVRSSAEASYYTTNEGGLGIAFQGMDVNADGVLDVKVITQNNVQVLYGVQ